jgi:hypothetical protein
MPPVLGYPEECLRREVLGEKKAMIPKDISKTHFRDSVTYAKAWYQYA